MNAPREEQLFRRLAAPFLENPAVSEGTGFGSKPGLRVEGKIFAMLVGDDLVLKLQKEQVDDLIDQGIAQRFDPGHGRPMKEWAAIPAQHSRRWRKLADEAFDFVRSTTRTRPR